MKIHLAWLSNSTQPQWHTIGDQANEWRR